MVLSRGRERKSDFSQEAIMARYEDKQFWNRGTILERLAEIKFLGLYFDLAVLPDPCDDK